MSDPYDFAPHGATCLVCDADLEVVGEYELLEMTPDVGEVVCLRCYDVLARSPEVAH